MIVEYKGRRGLPATVSPLRTMSVLQLAHAVKAGRVQLAEAQDELNRRRREHGSIDFVEAE